ncbi:MAG: deoxynucleoside kinase [Candidatus Neomarinimicrobiota bacterium]|nr:MAG: deoxynucleoside kinase [Candidatus Neomarinimicrobiota bacterium]
MRHLYYVAVEGPIGVGKTSLVKKMAEKLHARMVLEEFEDNPFLADFYREPERYAFQTQLFFLLQRYRQQQELRQVDMFHNLLITDYMFVKDRLFASLTLNEKEMNLYDTVANLLERNVLSPDLVIYLQADTDTLMANIEKRGRPYEENMSYEYIDALNQVYNEFFFRYQETPLVIINTNNIDFVHNPKDLEEVIQIIRQPISGTKFFNPTTSF